MPSQSETPLTARIVEWAAQKGYGFLQVGKQRVFLHIHDFAERHKRPEVGDKIYFTMGQDSKGRACPVNAAHVNDGGRISGLTVLALMSLAVLPALALRWRGVDLRWAGAYLFMMSALTYGAYAIDKQRARAMDRRLSESWLHFLELLGGWPGALLAQRRLRHKCSKPRYQFVFWLIVLAYQFVAFDSLREWEITRAALHSLDRAANPRR